MVPHPWQAEELLRLGGYLDPYDLSRQQVPTAENPMMLALPAANGSGKDLYLIAPFLVWLAISGIRNRGICTSSSFEQVKYQTEPGVLELIDRCHKVFGPIFKSVEFHHICHLTGSEIKLFATNEAKYAEGYHPWPGGKMALVMNEAKSIEEPIFMALTRCTGYSYWLEISSPGGKSGRFYRDAVGGIQHPGTCQLNKFYVRRVSAYDCPHIAKSHIDRQIADMPTWWIDSSINALFSDVDDSTIIPARYLDELARSTIKSDGDDIGIGLDSAAGVDENSLYVRQGNKIVFEYHFRQRDTTQTPLEIDRELTPWRHLQYTFNADDGGISHAIVDGLVRLGWRITRCNNQSPAVDKKRFLNLGIEMWYKLRKLIIRKELNHTFYNTATNIGDKHLYEQLITRKIDGQQSVQGRIKIEPKAAHKSRTGCSPDRADALVLTFWSYRSRYFDELANPPAAPRRSQFSSIADLSQRYGWEELTPPNKEPNGSRYTQQTSTI